MSESYNRMQAKFDEWSQDAQGILDNHILFDDCTHISDEDSVELFRSTEHDAMVQELLQLIFTSFHRNNTKAIT